MLSIIITAKEEPRTVGMAIRAFLKSVENYKLKNKEIKFEIIVVAPDKETLQAAKETYAEVKLMQDKDGGGKAAAMNLAIEKVQGEQLIFSDGDVEVAENVIEELLKIKSEAVTGRPVVTQALKHSSTKTLKHKNIKTQEKINIKAQKYEYWQECLVDMAHKIRLERDKKNEFLLLSGYLFLIKKEILKDFKFSENLLTEDEYLSYWLWQQGCKVKYASLAEVKVKYADNYHDWIKQKIRSVAGGYQIPVEWKKKIAMRSFSKEAVGGLKMIMDNVKTFKQAYWMKLLFIARLQAWLLAWWKVKILKQQRGQVWQRVESTK